MFLSTQDNSQQYKVNINVCNSIECAVRTYNIIHRHIFYGYTQNIVCNV